MKVVWIEAWKIAATQFENLLPMTHRVSMSSCILSIRFLLFLLDSTTINRTAPTAAAASSRMTTRTLLRIPATSPPLSPCLDEALSLSEMPGVYNTASDTPPVYVATRCISIGNCNNAPVTLS